MKDFHQPVLLKEVIQYLRIKKEGKYIDATVGGSGHARAILKLGGNILGLDCDPEALDHAREYLTTACPGTSWRLVKGNFRDLTKIVQAKDFAPVDGILLDLGVSSYQLETPQRGFSFKADYPLDMRMDPDLKVTAADLINGLNKGELKELFQKFGEEKLARRLAEAIVDARRLGQIKTCRQLSEIIVRAAGKFKTRIHPATRVFQALRMAVNDELNNLREVLPQALNLLKTGGRLMVISFHSGEDRIVKNFFKEKVEEGKLKIITKKPVTSSQEERKENPRSRSAKLRIGEKI